jgi:hypothetical protein
MLARDREAGTSGSTPDLMIIRSPLGFSQIKPAVGFADLQPAALRGFPYNAGQERFNRTLHHKQ